VQIDLSHPDRFICNSTSNLGCKICRRPSLSTVSAYSLPYLFNNTIFLIHLVLAPDNFSSWKICCPHSPFLASWRSTRFWLFQFVDFPFFDVCQLESTLFKDQDGHVGLFNQSIDRAGSRGRARTGAVCRALKTTKIRFTAILQYFLFDYRWRMCCDRVGLCTYVLEMKREREREKMVAHLRRTECLSFMCKLWVGWKMLGFPHTHDAFFIDVAKDTYPLPNLLICVTLVKKWFWGSNPGKKKRVRPEMLADLKFCYIASSYKVSHLNRYITFRNERTQMLRNYIIEVSVNQTSVIPRNNKITLVWSTETSIILFLNICVRSFRKVMYRSRWDTLYVCVCVYVRVTVEWKKRARERDREVRVLHTHARTRLFYKTLTALHFFWYVVTWKFVTLRPSCVRVYVRGIWSGEVMPDIIFCATGFFLDVSYCTRTFQNAPLWPKFCSGVVVVVCENFGFKSSQGEKLCTLFSVLNVALYRLWIAVR